MLAQITRVLGDQGISIASIIQKEVNDEARSAEIVIVTHSALEGAVDQALKLLAGLPVVNEIGSAIRIEEED